MSHEQITLPQPELTAPQRALLEQRLLGARQTTLKERPAPDIRPRPPREHLPLSFAQERLWFLDQLYPGQAVYTVFQAVRLIGRLDQTALEQSLNEIIRRHEAFRTNFTTHNGSPVQVVAPARLLRLARADVAALAGKDREAELQRVLQTEAARPFDLAADLLLRALLVRIGPGEHVLLLSMHHIISDGWSLGIIFRELSERYEAYAAGTPTPLPELPIQYADYAVWEREHARTAELEKSLAYWRSQVAGAPALDLPTDHPRPAVRTTRGAVRTLPLPPSLTHELKALGQREGVTLFMTLLAAFQTLLHRYTGQEDFTIGSCVAGRSQVELEKLVGFFVNTLVFRGNLAGNPTFRELLARTRETALGAFAHQDLPFEKLVEELQPDRSPGRNPFFQVMFVLQSATPPLPQAAGLDIQPFELDNGTAKFDLTLSLADQPQGLQLAMEYSADLFEADTITRMLGHYRTLLEAVAADPARPLRELPLATAAEVRQLLVEWNDTARDFPREETVHRLVEAQVARTPDAVALVFGHQTLSYGELNRRANQLAHRLRRLGVGPGTLVALCLERSPEMIVALLGILKAGGAYASLDPAYPAERLSFMLADSGASVVLTTERLGAILPQPESGGRAPAVLCLDADWPDIAREANANPGVAVTAEHLAYVSYTSGSTGKPKGVCIPHRAVNRLLLNTDYIRLGPDDGVAQISNCAFDASTFEVWGALLHGARLVILPSQIVLTPREFAAAIAAQGVTTLFVTTALFNQLVHAVPDFFRPLRHVLFGGEAAHPASVRAVLRHGPPQRLLHVYGPTETTTFATWHEVREVPPDATTVPIGRPLANTTLYVLDPERRPVPIGIPGELYIGGDGLAQGYLHRPELDAARFVPHPFSDRPGARLYQTGDRVRWRSDGTIEFLGRLDRQVKIRGYRIELEEIETVLEQHPAVQQTVALAREPVGGGDRRLVAYFVATDGAAPTPAELRRHLREKLPDYMVPAAFVPLPAMPLNANGKVELRALPAPETTPAGGVGFEAPHTDTEKRLAALWEQVLGAPRVGLNDNFFELGGHSLAGVRLFALIEAEFGRKMPLATLFQSPTVGQLACRLANGDPAGGGSSLVALQPKGDRPPLFFVHGAGVGNLWTYTNLLPHLGPDQPVYALESRAMHGGTEFTRIADMAAHYVQEIRAVQPHGPYYLSGYCFGGNVAYEMARQLAQHGEPIALLALLDSAPADDIYRRIPWWRPVFLFRFAVNTAYWLQDFLGQPPAERRRFVQRKSRTVGRKLVQLFRKRPARPDQDDIDLDDVIDVALFPEIVIHLWKIHLHALWTHRTGRYSGRVTLFRTRGQPFLCSFDPQFGWGGLAAGGVEVVNVPGSHEKIFMEPHVQILGARLRQCLTQAQARATQPTMEPSLL